MTKEIIVNFTPTGLIPAKSQTPYVPVTTDEIVDEVLSACEIGITTVHLHVRDDEGLPSNDSERYAQIIEKIRKYNKELVICVSLSGRYITDFNRCLVIKRVYYIRC